MRPVTQVGMKQLLLSGLPVKRKSACGWKRRSWTLLKRYSWTTAKKELILVNLQFNAKMKILRDQLSRRMRSYRHPFVLRDDALSVVIDPDKFPSEDGEFLSSPCKSKVVCKYFVVIASVGNLTWDTVWVIGNELVREEMHFRYIGGKRMWFMSDKSCRRVASVHNCTEACVRRGRHARPTHAPDLLNGGENHILFWRNGYFSFLG